MILGSLLRRDSLIAPRHPGLFAFAPGLRRGISLFALLALLTACSTALAQEPPPASGRIDDVDDTAFPAVRVIVTLVDADGRPITGLTPGDFAAEENGAAAEVTAVETVLDQQIGVGVILVIDTSGSMEGDPIAQAKTAARGFVQSLQEPDQAAVISFANAVTVLSPLTADRAETLAALDGLVALGNTALYSGVFEAVNLARTADLPRKAIILVSDGQDFGGASQNSREEALSLAAEARVPVYAIGLGLEIDRPFLEELASASGGAFIEAPAPDRIPEVYDQLSQLLRSQYVVTIESGAPADRADRGLRLTVETPQGPIELTADYTSRRTIVPATPSAPEPTPVPLVIGDEDSGGGSMLPLLLVVVGVGGLAFGFVYYKRVRERRELAREIAVMSRRAAEELNPDAFAAGRHAFTSLTRHVRIAGPDFEETFEIGDQPLTIGAGLACQIRLPDGVAEEYARVWLREGSLMLHQLAVGAAAPHGGRTAAWASLERGDQVEIGPYRLLVED
jgi:VWFA-related protein